MTKQISCFFTILALLAGCSQQTPRPSVTHADADRVLDIPLSEPFRNITVGMTREEVIRLAGKPSSQTDKTLFYSDLPDQLQEIKIRVDFVEGKVTKVEKYFSLQQDYPDLGKQMKEPQSQNRVPVTD